LGGGAAEPSELLRQSLEEESDSDAESSAKETMSATDSVAGDRKQSGNDALGDDALPRLRPSVEVKVP
jgi:hypothetical protein